MSRYLITQLDQLPAVPCPCGQSRRGFAGPDNSLATVHVVDIGGAPRTHYHQRRTEIYVVLAGEGQVQLDGQLFPLKPLTAVMIKPGCRHRALGQLRLLNVVIPAFDPADEWFDEGVSGGG